MPNPDATQPSPQPAEDLERVLMEIDLNWHAEDAPPEQLNTDFARLVHRHWPTIRAALRERRELREAIREGVEILKLSPPSNWLGDPEYISWLDHVKALLAQPAAGEERESVGDWNWEAEVIQLRREIAGLPGDRKYRDGADYALESLLARWRMRQRLAALAPDQPAEAAPGVVVGPIAKPSFTAAAQPAEAGGEERVRPPDD